MCRGLKYKEEETKIGDDDDAALINDDWFVGEIAQVYSHIRGCCKQIKYKYFFRNGKTKKKILSLIYFSSFN